MTHKTRIGALVISLCLFGASIAPASAGNGTGGNNGGSTGGGLAGGNNGGSGGLGAGGNCGAGRILAVFDENVWNAHPKPYPNGAALTPFVYPGYTNFSTQMVFLVDFTTGLVWGPPTLQGYNAALGEGYAPATTGPFGASGSPPGFDGYIGYAPDWACYNGGPPTSVPSAPVASAFVMTQPTGTIKTKTDATKSALVFDPVHASPATVCPSGVNAVALGAPFPFPAVTNYSTPPPGCPDSAIQHESDKTGEWHVALPEVAVPAPATGCSGGTSGTWKWDWSPNPNTFNPATGAYVLGSHYFDCNNGPTDPMTFEHVLGKVPGLTVTLTRNWAYDCGGGFATLQVPAGGAVIDSWTWPGLVSTPTAAANTGKMTKPDGNWYQVNCDAGYTQTYATLNPTIPVEQIESLAG